MPFRRRAQNGGVAETDSEQTDPFLWLEEVTGDDALAWVREHNDPTLAEFGGERFEQMRTEALEVLDTDARIPYVRRRGEYLYNFWRDADQPARAVAAHHAGELPHRETRLGRHHRRRRTRRAPTAQNWVWAGADVIEPEHSLALISLSRGGSDAAVVREFDMRTSEFVDGGFELARGQVAGDLGGRGHRSGRHRLRRGLADRIGLSRGWSSGGGAGSRWPMRRPCSAVSRPTSSSPDRGTTPRVSNARCVSRALDFFNEEVYELRDGELIRIDTPTDASISVHRNGC